MDQSSAALAAKQGADEFMVITRWAFDHDSLEGGSNSKARVPYFNVFSPSVEKRSVF